MLTTLSKWALIFFCGTLIEACSTIDYNHRVEDWPNLTQIEHRVSQKEMHDACDKYASPLETVLACAIFDFDALTCDMWFVDPVEQWKVDHEKAHCIGYEHTGPAYDLHRMWDEWKKQHRESQ